MSCTKVALSSPIPSAHRLAQSGAACASEDSRSRAYSLWDDVYLRDDFVMLPGSTNALSEPIALIEPMMELWSSKGPGITEAKCDAAIRVIQSPFIITESLASAIPVVHKIGRLLGACKPALDGFASAIQASIIGGLILLGFEALIETKDLIFHTLPLLFSLNSDHEKGNIPKIFQTIIAKNPESDPLIYKLSQLDRRYISLTDREEFKVMGKENLFDPLDTQAESSTARFSSRTDAILQEIKTHCKELYPTCASLVKIQREEIIQGLTSPSLRAQKDAIGKANHLFQKLKSVALVPIQKALTDSLIESKNRDLAIRVRPWLAQQIDETLPNLLDALRNGTPQEKELAQIEAKELLKKIKTQAIKKVIGHVLGYAAISLTITGLALASAVTAYIIMTVALFSGAGFGIARYLFNKGVSDSEGWRFNADICIPEIVKKTWRWYFNETAAKPIDAKRRSF